MGINAFAIRELPGNQRPFLCAEFASEDGAGHRTQVELEPSRFRDRPHEIILWSKRVKIGGDHGLDYHPNELRIRIHGQTTVRLMDALLEDPNTRRYLASGVDHFRAKEAKEKAA